MSPQRRLLMLTILTAGLIGGGVFLWQRDAANTEPQRELVANPSADARAIDPDEIPLVSTISRREQLADGYTLNIEYPKLSLVSHPALADQASDVIARAVQDQIDAFARDVRSLSKADGDEAAPPSVESSFTLRSTMLLVSPSIVSVRFDSSGYVAGAAHPNNRSTILNYSLVDHTTLRTEELFASSTEALPFLAETSRTKLRAILGSVTEEEFRAFVVPGTEPTAENFANVGITPRGLVIVFPPYQIAPGAMGAIEVKLDTADYGPQFAETIRRAMTLAVENIEIAAPETRTPNLPE
ncbi:MAG TPA: RsiV family protein [Candidatus Paceibacterota bacterium]|nr:RsiV family protein [Candidatus Paceibacterota bacterium]